MYFIIICSFLSLLCHSTCSKSVLQQDVWPMVHCMMVARGQGTKVLLHVDESWFVMLMWLQVVTPQWDMITFWVFFFLSGSILKLSPLDFKDFLASTASLSLIWYFILCKQILFIYNVGKKFPIILLMTGSCPNWRLHHDTAHVWAAASKCIFMTLAHPVLDHDLIYLQ